MKKMISLLFLVLSSCSIYSGSRDVSSESKSGVRGIAAEEAALTAEQISVKDQLLIALNDDAASKRVVNTIDALLPQVQKLAEEGKLKPVILDVAQKALAAGKLPPRLTAENLEENVDLFVASIENQFVLKGLSQKHPQQYVSWLKASRSIRDKAQKTSIPPSGPKSKSLFLNPAFIKELEGVAESTFTDAAELRLLVNGTQSFPAREQLFQNAKSSIYIKTWAMEDDVTGWKFAKLIHEKHKAGVDVRVIVDWKTARQSVYRKVPEWLSSQGVPVIFWRDPEAPMYAFHKKTIVVDHQHLIAGGMNFGDVYSHLGPPEIPKWRDTDFQASGSIALTADIDFQKEWNSQIKKHQLPLAPFSAPMALPAASAATAATKIMAIDLTPNPQINDTILTSIVKGIEGATKEINIENAYFIENPALQNALVRAIKRGVKVRIFTNSMNSIDVPIIARPIIEALPIYFRLNAEVYLKKGATLHSKFMTIDNVASWVMSYNHHPQSMRIQGEVAYVILDKKFSKQLADQFIEDTKTIADRVTDAKMLELEPSFLDVVLKRYFFDQL
ncbi:MAG: phosphatidylserine/phosphatidylglycerophosphate/cardiolipin synthase family protein [Bdellovibrionales bacterium]|nr:phosphatidylserine/phosphatidylglycerophosphate/cardiolipin synthase family protein [Bdellovibrionales bacterium]